MCLYPGAWGSAPPVTAVMEWTPKIICVGDAVWDDEISLKWKLRYWNWAWQKNLIKKDMEILLVPDNKKGQLLLTYSWNYKQKTFEHNLFHATFLFLLLEE